MNISFAMARKCINPEVPVSLAGYFNRRMWDHVLDDIEVRALVLKDGKGKKAAFVNFDMRRISAHSPSAPTSPAT